MKNILFLALYLLSVIAFGLGLFVDMNLMPEWDAVLTIISGVVFGSITAIKGLGLEIPVVQPFIKKIITSIFVYFQDKKLEKYLKKYKNNNEEDYPL